MAHVQGTVIVHFNKVPQALQKNVRLLSQRPVTTLWIGPSPSFCWFAQLERAYRSSVHTDLAVPHAL